MKNQPKLFPDQQKAFVYIWDCWRRIDEEESLIEQKARSYIPDFDPWEQHVLRRPCEVSPVGLCVIRRDGVCRYCGAQSDE